jgi:hypothetical protein
MPDRQDCAAARQETTHAFANSHDDLARRDMERRAVEAVIWGMPAVNTDLMRQEMFRKTRGKENEVLYWSRSADANNQTLTPNPPPTKFSDASSVLFDVPMKRCRCSTAMYRSLI